MINFLNKLDTANDYTMAKNEEDTDEEENVYKESARDDLVDNDEISPEEEGFMQGYDERKEKTDDYDETGDEE